MTHARTTASGACVGRCHALLEASSRVADTQITLAPLRPPRGCVSQHQSVGTSARLLPPADRRIVSHLHIPITASHSHRQGPSLSAHHPDAQRSALELASRRGSIHLYIPSPDSARAQLRKLACKPQTPSPCSRRLVPATDLTILNCDSHQLASTQSIHHRHIPTQQPPPPP